MICIILDGENIFYCDQYLRFKTKISIKCKNTLRRNIFCHLKKFKNIKVLRKRKVKIFKMSKHTLKNYASSLCCNYTLEPLSYKSHYY